MADGLITYNHEALQETVQQMLNINGQITEQMNDLEKQVNANKELFLGSSSDQYGQLAGTIHGELTASTERLHAVANGIQAGANDIQDQDKRLANLFS